MRSQGFGADGFVDVFPHGHLGLGCRVFMFQCGTVAAAKLTRLEAQKLDSFWYNENLAK